MAVKKPYKTKRTERKVGFSTTDMVVSSMLEQRNKKAKRDARGRTPKGPARLPSLKQLNEERRRQLREAQKEAQALANSAG